MTTKLLSGFDACRSGPEVNLFRNICGTTIAEISLSLAPSYDEANV